MHLATSSALYKTGLIELITSNTNIFCGALAFYWPFLFSARCWRYVASRADHIQSDKEILQGFIYACKSHLTQAIEPVESNLIAKAKGNLVQFAPSGFKDHYKMINYKILSPKDKEYHDYISKKIESTFCKQD